MNMARKVGGCLAIAGTVGYYGLSQMAATHWSSLPATYPFAVLVLKEVFLVTFFYGLAGLTFG